MNQVVKTPEVPLKTGAGSRWLRLILLVVGIGAIAALLWIVLASRAVVSGADRRNQADLAIAAGGLEQWSGAIAGLARANFIHGRVAPLPQGERDYGDGWRYRAWLRHPALDEFKVDYVVTSQDACKEIRKRIADAEGPLPFVDDYYDPGAKYLKIVAHFPLALIWRIDTGTDIANSTAQTRREYLADIVGTPAKERRTPRADDVVCFAAGIPLERLLVLDKAARAFSTLMVVDRDRRIVAQVGTDRMPLTSLNGLAPANSILTKTLAVSLGQQQAATDQRERKLADSLDPVDLDIGGRKLIAYVRPFVPPAGFDVCKAVAPAPALPTIAFSVGTATAQAVARAPPPKPTRSAGDAAQPAAAPVTGGECLVVALAPKATVWRQVLALPMVIGVSLALAVLILIALLPTLRLILLGPGEAINRAEAIGVVLGIPAVVSLATLVLLFLFDLSVHRAATRMQAETIAATVAARAEHQLGDTIRLFHQASTRPSSEKHATDETRLKFPYRKVLPARLVPSAIEGCDSDEGPKPSEKSLLRANPNPVCRVKDFCRFLRHSHLPAIDSISLFDENGRQLDKARTTVCRGFAGGRANVSAREYFVRLRDDSGPLFDGVDKTGWPYVLAHVASLQDGIAKSIVARRVLPLQPAPSPTPSRARAGMVTARASTKAPDPRGRIYAVGTTTLTEVMAPVLPPPFGLMIVDTRSNVLPVLHHPTPGRSGTETLARMLPNVGAIRDQLRSMHETVDGAEQPVRATAQQPDDVKRPVTLFTGFYDGTRRMFVARPIRGTHWVAIVHYGLADVDDVAARTVRHTLQSWAAFSILSVGAWLLWLQLTGRRGWPRLWPQRAREADYNWLAIVFAVLGVAGMIFFALNWATGPIGAILVLLVGFVIRILAALVLHIVLGLRPPADRKTTLRPLTQRIYLRMLAPLLLCLSVVPMTGFWLEARQFTLMELRQETFEAFTAPGGVFDANRLAFDRLRWAYGIPQPSGAAAPTGYMPGAYQVDLRRGSLTPGAAHDDFISGIISGATSRPKLAGCPPVGAARAPRPLNTPANPAVRLCYDGQAYGIDFAGLPSFGLAPGWITLFMLCVVAVALFFATQLIVMRVLRALAGFGVALNAVDYPHLFLGDLWAEPRPKRSSPLVTLNRKSLLVNAPWVVFPMLKRRVADRMIRINIANPSSGPVAMREGSIVIFTGLELVLADRERRLGALDILERACRVLAELGPDTTARLIIMSESAPLERILDAFERDDSRPKFDGARENLRWSRLFEDFATYSFEQSMLTVPLPADICGPIDRHELSIINVVLEECRWLPPRIVNGGIGCEILLEDAVIDTAIVPIEDGIYQAKWREPLIRWVRARDFPGRNAARAYLRNQFIEYYQRLWLSSTDAEHLVMHNMAHHRFVNIGAALAFASLVRRGIVVLDPEPKLMNKSFAMFVRQAEKLDTVMAWRNALPASAWATARLPIFVIIGVALTALIGMLIASGEEPSALLPVLAAGIPAIVAALRRLVRQ